MSLADIAHHLIDWRRRICPKTSYATSGTSASDLLVFSTATRQYLDLEKSVHRVQNYLEDDVVDQLSRQVTESKEFERLCISSIEALLNNESKTKEIQGHVLLLVIHSISSEAEPKLCNRLSSFIQSGKSKLIIILLIDNPNILSLNSFSLDRDKAVVSSFQYGGYSLIQLHTALKVNQLSTAIQGTPSLIDSLGFNHQPSVQSRRQFRYLWNYAEESNPTLKIVLHDAKKRVLQRLDSKNVVDLSTNMKLKSLDWDQIITNLLTNNGDDFYVYDKIRQLTTGKTIEESLISDTSLTSSMAINDADEGHGRADFMVNRILECIPENFQRNGSIHQLLDYGCAEGAITASLGKALRLQPQNILGADIRVIPSPGFTFIHLQAEEKYAETINYRIFPQILTGAIDLVTASMVFHHVKHVRETVLELRRIVSPSGILVIREHHCDSTGMATFLDITHGLYSLSWSTPVEWPNFLNEYEAYYRSREKWTELIASCGFKLCDPNTISKSAEKLYHAIDNNRIKPDGSIPNVIKAYYATYIPDPNFIHHVDDSRKSEVIGSGSKRKLAELKQVISDESISINKFRSSDSTQENLEKVDVWESSKYPGSFYLVDKATMERFWVEIRGDKCYCTQKKKLYVISNFHTMASQQKNLGRPDKIS